MKRYETGNLRFWTEDELLVLKEATDMVNYLKGIAEHVHLCGMVANMDTFAKQLSKVENLLNELSGGVE